MKTNQKELAKMVGSNLRKARKSKGITQTDLAKEMGKHQPDYSDYETGKVQLDYAKILFLCNRLGITPNDLFTEELMEYQQNNKD